MLSQFSRELPQHITLQDFLEVDNDIYPVGRLDKDSEGLLLLTNDNRFKTKLLDPKTKSSKTYWVQVEGDITESAVRSLTKGVTIKLKKGNYNTRPAKCTIIKPKNTEPRNPPIRERKNIPTSWIEITITEGKNRQVRKMCAAVDFPCLRLIRTVIKGVKFDDVQTGKYRPLTKKEIHLLSNL